MGGLDVWLDRLPDWAGTAPQWGMFILLAVAIVRTSPQWLTTWVTLRLARSNRNASRIVDLEKQVKDCHEECTRHVNELNEVVDGLKTKLNNEAWQRTQSEISLVNTLLDVVDAPQLKIILAALQRRALLLPAEATAIGKPKEPSDED